MFGLAARWKRRRPDPIAQLAKAIEALGNGLLAHPANTRLRTDLTAGSLSTLGFYAELLRDMWLVGPVVSTVLWPVTKLFEYKVAGTLGQPKAEPVYFVPKIVLMPFHPLRTLKELIPAEPVPAGTNSPPRTQ